MERDVQSPPSYFIHPEEAIDMLIQENTTQDGRTIHLSPVVKKIIIINHIVVLSLCFCYTAIDSLSTCYSNHVISSNK